MFAVPTQPPMFTTEQVADITTDPAVQTWMAAVAESGRAW